MSCSTNVFFRGACAALLAVILTLPTATAGHWTIHYSAVDKHAGATVEDDGAILYAPGNPLHGRVNNVVAPGASPGDGSLFLDARAANWVGYTTSAAAGVEFSPSAFAGDLTGREDILLPGIHHTSAWYGWWSDINMDGDIDDRHDTACGVDRCADDEFAWRGIASRDAPGVIHFTVPRPSTTTWFSALGNESQYWQKVMVDQTNPTNVEQSWAGAIVRNSDGPLLTTIQTLVLASDRRVPGSPFVYDFDDPGARWDVDRYESLNSDVEILYRATAAVVQSVDTSAADGVLAIYRGIVGENEEAFDALGQAIDEFIALGALGLIFFAAFLPLTASTAPSPREPTTAEDDYEGRALWGGAGDLRGSGNTFPGYLDGFALWMDNRARTMACAGAYARVDATATELERWVTCSTGDSDVLGKQRLNARGTGALLGFEVAPILWRDLNRDGHVGAKCDPDDPEAFDSEANACRVWGTYYQTLAGSEVEGVCDVSHAKGGTITLTPMGGNWPNVVIVRDHRFATRVAFDTHWEVRSDDSPILLRWDDECVDSTTLRSRDSLFVPTAGTSVPIRVETEARIVGFKDTALGVEIGAQRVRDVDILPATL